MFLLEKKISKDRLFYIFGGHGEMRGQKAIHSNEKQIKKEGQKERGMGVNKQIQKPPHKYRSWPQ